MTAADRRRGRRPHPYPRPLVRWRAQLRGRGLHAIRDLAIKPEHECFDIGHVASLAPLVEMGLLKAPLHADFVMGVLGGVPTTTRDLARMADTLADAWPEHKHWGVIGIGRAQWRMVAAALTLGGSIRVGLEDNFYLRGGEMARSNGDLVRRARRLCEDCSRRPATVGEARDLLGTGAPAPVSTRTAA
jgi:3-keto-5-aminohexanoate cleavage enzyme